jgi:hypothetical protein
MSICQDVERSYHSPWPCPYGNPYVVVVRSDSLIPGFKHTENFIGREVAEYDDDTGDPIYRTCLTEWRDFATIFEPVDVYRNKQRAREYFRQSKTFKKWEKKTLLGSAKAYKKVLDKDPGEAKKFYQALVHAHLTTLAKIIKKHYNLTTPFYLQAVELVHTDMDFVVPGHKATQAKRARKE